MSFCCARTDMEPSGHVITALFHNGRGARGSEGIFTGPRRECAYDAGQNDNSVAYGRHK